MKREDQKIQIGTLLGFQELNNNKPFKKLSGFFVFYRLQPCPVLKKPEKDLHTPPPSVIALFQV
ncbi:hypothetical protein OOZ15_03090 [Galbibacter sp. EGI 63066]|uniref:hypothetical protein n=1 Tax=Galbibacter sp. EGI 63066 TaxID=2993559 RepID=UPI002249688A|nr:hypothetical protein [Galbibacter sp. EGI 63066]MCX2678915.1 hypothetical protein [Galbibacter sp. EGI 63066]